MNTVGRISTKCKNFYEVLWVAGVCGRRYLYMSSNLSHSGRVTRVHTLNNCMRIKLRRQPPYFRVESRTATRQVDRWI